MPLIILYLVTKYIVYGLNTLQDITICLFYVTFDLHLRYSDFVKVTCNLIVRCVLCCEMFVPKMEYVGSVEFEIWTFGWRKLKCRHYGVINHFHEIQIQRAYLTGKPNFSFNFPIRKVLLTHTFWSFFGVGYFSVNNNNSGCN